MNKIICYSCSELIELNEAKEFSTIQCPICQQDLNIPKIIGDFVCEKQLSENRLYSTYKGHKSDLEETLVIKVLKDSENINDIFFSKLEKQLSRVPDTCRLKLLKNGSSFIAYRPFYETSIKDYLQNSRPQKEKAIFILKKVASLLDECAKNVVFPSDLMIGNVQMDRNGEIIISDILFRESIDELLNLNNDTSILNLHCTSLKYLNNKSRNINNSIFSFGCLSYVLCCGTYPWPNGSFSHVQKARNISPEVILNLRDENPELLKNLIISLIDEKSDKIQSFQKVIDILNSKTSKSTPKPVPNSKKKFLKDPGKAKFKPRKNRKKSSALPIFAGLFLVLAFVIIVIAKKSNKSQTKETEIVKKAPVFKKKKVTKKAQKATNKKPPTKTKITAQPPAQEIKPLIAKVIPKIDREAVKAELMPLDFNFDPLIDKLDEYIEATKQKERELEEDKITLVSTYRDHLLIHFYRKPYTGVFYLQNKKPFRGKIVKADDTNIHLTMLKNNKPMVISWKDFEFNQLHDFADYYGASYTEGFSLSENNDKIFKKVANEYSKLAVVLDWYGFKEQAVNYKRKSIKFDASLVTVLDLLIKEEPTN